MTWYSCVLALQVITDRKLASFTLLIATVVNYRCDHWTLDNS